MKTKFLAILSLCFFITGCAKYSKQEIANASYNYRVSQNKVDSLQSKLNSNDAFRNGHCELPPKGAKPRIYVTSEQEAKKYATAYCYSPVACQVGSLAVDVDSFTERFLASEACGRMTDELRADGQISNSTELNFIEAVVDSGCDNDVDGFLGGLLSLVTCIPAVAIDLAKMEQLENCLSNKHTQLLNASRKWHSAPTEKLEACRNAKQQLSYAEQELSRHRNTYQMMVNY